MDEQVMTFGELMAMRAGVYRMLGSVYFTELTAEQIEEFSQYDFEAFAGLDEELAAGAKEVQRALRHVNSSTREELAVDYAHTFLAAGAGKNDVRAVPYESVYTSESGLLMGAARQSVYKTMLKEGVLPDSMLRTPDDHLSFECEFMATLADRAAQAQAEGDAEEAKRLLEVQQEFRINHLENWIGMLYDAIDSHCRTRFYRGIGLMTKAFVRFDKELLAEGFALLEEN